MSGLACPKPQFLSKSRVCVPSEPMKPANNGKNQLILYQQCVLYVSIDIRSFKPLISYSK
jgi:hypothetical protein